MLATCHHDLTIDIGTLKSSFDDIKWVQYPCNICGYKRVDCTLNRVVVVR